MSLTISRILHAGYIFASTGTRIAFDPVFENPFSRNCHAFPPVRFDLESVRAQHFDAVFISHFHDDHCSLESLDLIDRDTPIYLYCIFDELFDMIRQMGFRQVHSLKLDESVKIGPFDIIPRQALDAEIDALFHIRVNGLEILNVVDAWIAPRTLDQLAAFAPWDMVMWPFQTMREIDVIAPTRAKPSEGTLPEEWLQQLQLLQPHIVVPGACQFVQEPWSWYNHAMFPVTYREFTRVIGEILPLTRVLRMDPGISVQLTSEGATEAKRLDWVIPTGEQDVDFHYAPELPAPPTADIARHFPALTPAQYQHVLHWCTHTLPTRHDEAEPPEDEWFATPRLWRLTLHHHDGKATTLFYKASTNSLEYLPQPEGEPAWCTDVPASKLYSALEQGESLTSMYMRINDCTFSPDIEAQIADVDVLDDPLIRCLFDGEFAAYQREQLRRLGY